VKGGEDRRTGKWREGVKGEGKREGRDIEEGKGGEGRRAPPN